MRTRTLCPPDHQHGETSTCYVSHLCGCEDCRTANGERSFYRRHMIKAGREDAFEATVDGRGVNRRLQALMAIGWSCARLAPHVGVSPDQVRMWLTYPRVTLTTHDRIAALYDHLSDHPAPAADAGQRQSVTRAIHTAQQRGYARPIDWDDIDLDDAPQTGVEVVVDEVAVQLALEGSRVHLTREERHIAVRELNGRRYNDQEIAQMLGVDPRTILRDRQDLDLPAHPEPYQERFAA